MIPPSMMRRLTQPFAIGQFTPTRHTSAEGKARFANELMRFIARDFPMSLFSARLYGHLSMSFGHIAHSNREQFYEVFFSGTGNKIEFLRQTIGHVPVGDAAFSCSDVECEVRHRLRDSGIQLLYESLLRSETTSAERIEYERLRSKFEAVPPTGADHRDMQDTQPEAPKAASASAQRRRQIAVIEDLFAYRRPN